MRDIQGSPAEKLALFQKVKAAGGFANEDPAELKAAETYCGRSRRPKRRVGEDRTRAMRRIFRTR
jgi:hypothetical protein